MFERFVQKVITALMAVMYSGPRKCTCEKPAKEPAPFSVDFELADGTDPAPMNLAPNVLRPGFVLNSEYDSVRFSDISYDPADKILRIYQLAGPEAVVTELVKEFSAVDQPNRTLLLKLDEREEQFGYSRIVCGKKPLLIAAGDIVRANRMCIIGSLVFQTDHTY